MSTLEELQTLMREKYGLAEADLDPHASLAAKGVDSLALVEFMFTIEEHFHIELGDANPKIDTLAELADIIDKILAEKTPT